MCKQLQLRSIFTVPAFLQSVATMKIVMTGIHPLAGVQSVHCVCVGGGLCV